jgi:hypothetical protein
MVAGPDLNRPLNPEPPVVNPGPIEMALAEALTRAAEGGQERTRAFWAAVDQWPRRQASEPLPSSAFGAAASIASS